MAGYLDSYGAGDERRERRNKRIAIWGLLTVIMALALYFTFRDWRQERVVKQFLTLLRQQDYQGAFKLWAPSKYYPPEKFNEDWGPSTPFATPAPSKTPPKAPPGGGGGFKPRGSQRTAYRGRGKRGGGGRGRAPTGGPGKHWQIWEFLKSKFG